MNKKLIIPIICISIIIIGIIGFILWNNRTVSTIILDINPSVKISLKKDGKVKKVEALNDDAKEIISDDLKGKTLDDTLDVITKNVVEKGFVEENQVIVIVHTEGKTNNEEVKTKLSEKFNGNQIHAEIIEVEKVTKEDEKLAKKYGISPSKASYINSVDNIPVESLVEKEVSEIKETKETGYYCDNGYNLEGGNCVKELGRKAALNGTICPNGFIDENGTCYEEVPVEETDKLLCNEDFKLENDKCVRILTEDAQVEYSCEKGELMKKGDVNPIGASDNDKYYCVDKSTGKPPTLRCLTNPGHIMIAGKCYNGPAPLINGGCPNGDTVMNGGCYSLDNEDQWVCPSGNIYEKSKGTYVELCPDTFTYITPNIKGYSCSEGFKLEDNKCVKNEEMPAEKERVCKTGYTLVDNSRCMNYKKTADKFSGYYCEDQRATLVNNTCIIYEIIEAKHN